MEITDARTNRALTPPPTRKKPGPDSGKTLVNAVIPSPPTRQALFPYAGPEALTAGALDHAIRRLQELGFTIDQSGTGAWALGWPGCTLKIWRHSPGQLCQFAQNQAPDYARRARARQTAQSHTFIGPDAQPQQG